MDPRRFSIVIPTYNDTAHLPHIVSELKKSPWCGDIIVVDDGSAPAHRQCLDSLAGVILRRHERNRGKAQALKTGVMAAHGERIAFVDADLRTFRVSHFDQMVRALEKHDWDMVIGARCKETYLTMLVGYSHAYAGERLFRSRTLLLQSGVLDTRGYLVEASINAYYFHYKKVGMVFLPNLAQTLKVQKRGWMRGLAQETGMFFDYVSYLGVREFLFQLAFVKGLETDFLRCLNAPLEFKVFSAILDVRRSRLIALTRKSGLRRKVRIPVPHHFYLRRRAKHTRKYENNIAHVIKTLSVKMVRDKRNG